MRPSKRSLGATLAVVAAAVGAAVFLAPNWSASHAADGADGQGISRFDTFGDEQLSTDTLGLHLVIEERLDPLTALQVGLKVDAEAIPADLAQAILDGEVDLTAEKLQLVEFLKSL